MKLISCKVKQPSAADYRAEKEALAVIIGNRIATAKATGAKYVLLTAANAGRVLAVLEGKR